MCVMLWHLFLATDQSQPAGKNSTGNTIMMIMTIERDYNLPCSQYNAYYTIAHIANTIQVLKNWKLSIITMCQPK